MNFLVNGRSLLSWLTYFLLPKFGITFHLENSQCIWLFQVFQELLSRQRKRLVWKNMVFSNLNNKYVLVYNFELSTNYLWPLSTPNNYACVHVTYTIYKHASPHAGMVEAGGQGVRPDFCRIEGNPAALGSILIIHGTHYSYLKRVYFSY